MRVARALSEPAVWHKVRVEKCLRHVLRNQGIDAGTMAGAVGTEESSKLGRLAISMVGLSVTRGVRTNAVHRKCQALHEIIRGCR